MCVRDDMLFWMTFWSCGYVWWRETAFKKKKKLSRCRCGVCTHHISQISSRLLFHKKNLCQKRFGARCDGVSSSLYRYSKKGFKATTTTTTTNQNNLQTSQKKNETDDCAAVAHHIYTKEKKKSQKRAFTTHTQLFVVVVAFYEWREREKDRGYIYNTKKFGAKGVWPADIIPRNLEHGVWCFHHHFGYIARSSGHNNNDDDDNNQPERYIQNVTKNNNETDCVLRLANFSQEHIHHTVVLLSSHFFEWRDIDLGCQEIWNKVWCFNIIIEYYKARVLRPRRRQPTRTLYTNVTKNNNETVWCSWHYILTPRRKRKHTRASTTQSFVIVAFF